MSALALSVLLASNLYGLDPNLVAAIVQVESSGRPYVTGPAGEIGLMQLRPEFHKCATYDILENVRCGVQYLAYVKRKKQKVWGNAWFVGYNYGPYSKIKGPAKTLYYKKVMEALNGY